VDWREMGLAQNLVRWRALVFCCHGVSHYFRNYDRRKRRSSDHCLWTTTLPERLIEWLAGFISHASCRKCQQQVLRADSPHSSKPSPTPSVCIGEGCEEWLSEVCDDMVSWELEGRLPLIVQTAAFSVWRNL